MQTITVCPATAGLDYVPVNRILEFKPGVKYQEFKVTILDDLGRPKIEGEESFELVLQMPMGGRLGTPSTAVVTLNDSISDCEYLTVNGLMDWCCQ